MISVLPYQMDKIKQISHFDLLAHTPILRSVRDRSFQIKNIRSEGYDPVIKMTIDTINLTTHYRHVHFRIFMNDRYSGDIKISLSNNDLCINNFKPFGEHGGSGHNEFRNLGISSTIVNWLSTEALLMGLTMRNLMTSNISLVKIYSGYFADKSKITADESVVDLKDASNKFGIYSHHIWDYLNIVSGGENKGYVKLSVSDKNNDIYRILDVTKNEGLYIGQAIKIHKGILFGAAKAGNFLNTGYELENPSQDHYVMVWGKPSPLFPVEITHL